MGPDEPPALTVTVSYSPGAGVVDEVVVRLPPGAMVIDAIAASGLQQRHPSVDVAALPIGVWGERCLPPRVLRDRDRVELYRPLTVDPKAARRLRHEAASAPRRSGGKPRRPASATPDQAKPSR